jgi:alpha-D-ribose 1-methylphosphonate 5-triphosphate synthase subunit PhnG
LPGYQVLRGPEAGLVMTRGRAGGGGAPFNLGEMTATRCTVRTEQGFVGHAYVAGRNERLTELAALADALLQDPMRQTALLQEVIEPLATMQQSRRDAVSAKAAATRVQFFAMRNMRS